MSEATHTRVGGTGQVPAEASASLLADRCLSDIVANSLAAEVTAAIAKAEDVQKEKDEASEALRRELREGFASDAQFEEAQKKWQALLGHKPRGACMTCGQYDMTSGRVPHRRVFVAVSRRTLIGWVLSDVIADTPRPTCTFRRRH